ncbi:putative MoxR-like ATPase [Sesbania bispinosa]|nr:putative MoxR-like ATPase [Sesbania bispinosa]
MAISECSMPRFVSTYNVAVRTSLLRLSNLDRLGSSVGRARLVIDGEEEAGMGDMAMQVHFSYLAPIDKLPNPRQVQVYQLSCGVFGWLERGGSWFGI